MLRKMLASSSMGNRSVVVSDGGQTLLPTSVQVVSPIPRTGDGMACQSGYFRLYKWLPMACPPSTRMVAPVVKLEAGEAR